jgi:hypothetical protein
LNFGLKTAGHRRERAGNDSYFSSIFVVTILNKAGYIIARVEEISTKNFV